MPARRIKRDVNEAARDVARALAKTQAFAQSRRALSSAGAVLLGSARIAIFRALEATALPRHFR
jgi:hypothetical protein